MIRRDTRCSTSTTGTMTRNPGGRTPCTRPSRNSTPCSYCLTIRTANARTSRISTTTTMAAVDRVFMAVLLWAADQTVIRADCQKSWLTGTSAERGQGPPTCPGLLVESRGSAPLVPASRLFGHSDSRRLAGDHHDLLAGLRGRLVVSPLMLGAWPVSPLHGPVG